MVQVRRALGSRLGQELRWQLSEWRFGDVRTLALLAAAQLLVCLVCYGAVAASDSHDRDEAAARAAGLLVCIVPPGWSKWPSW